MPLTKKKLAKEIIRASLKMHALRAWERFGNRDLVALTIPGTSATAYASIMGAGGEEFGLTLHLGEESPSLLLEAFEDDLPPGESTERSHLLAFGITPLGDIPPYSRKLLDLARFQGRREAPAPWLLAKEPGRRARNPNRDELEILLYATRALVEVLEAGRVDPVEFAVGAKISHLTIEGEPRSPTVRVDRLEVERPGEKEAPAPVRVPDELAALPLRDAVWQVGLPVLPTAIRNDDRTARALLVLDPDGPMVACRIVLGSEDVAGEFFRAVLEPSKDVAGPHLPRRILIGHRALHRQLDAPLTDLGISVSYERDLPELDEAADDLIGHMLGGEYGVPDPTDLRGWKRVDSEFTGGAHDLLGGELIANDRNLAEFFGTAKTGRKLLEGKFDEGTGPSYLEWLLSFHRPGPHAPRTGERLLAARALRPVERILLRNRMNGRLSIYRIEALGDEGRVQLVDVLDGSNHVVRDFSTAGNPAGIDHVLPLLVFRAGSFSFLSVFGPPLVGELADEALDYLEQLVGPLDPGSLARKPEALGRLWAWVDRATRRPAPTVRFVNADGEDWAVRQVPFDLDDEAAARRLLEKRPDIHPDGPDYLWVPGTKGGKGMTSEPIVRGRIRFDEGEEGGRVEANSAERVRALRTILEEIPGFRAGPESDLTPGRIREGAQDSGEVREIVLEEYRGTETNREAAVRDLDERLRRHYLDWIDLEVPALGGRSPRQLCETEEGKRRVARRIRAMRRPGPEGGKTFDIPREEMLRRLGIEDE